MIAILPVSMIIFRYVCILETYVYVCMDNTDQYIHIHVYVQLINLLFTFTLESQSCCLVHARDLS